MFDENVWSRIIDKCQKCGLNTIALDVNDGVEYASHPEISIKGAWGKEKVKREALRLREKVITTIPKLNFSTTHDVWMGEYGTMVSASIYYKVCRDLVFEVYDMFLQPEYIHIGMDEENWTLISEQDEEVREWYRVQFVKRYGYTVEYVEVSPSVIKAMALVEKFMEEGHRFILTTSNLYMKNCEKDAIIMETIELLGEAIKNVK